MIRIYPEIILWAHVLVRIAAARYDGERQFLISSNDSKMELSTKINPLPILFDSCFYNYSWSRQRSAYCRRINVVLVSTGISIWKISIVGWRRGWYADQKVQNRSKDNSVSQEDILEHYWVEIETTVQICSKNNVFEVIVRIGKHFDYLVMIQFQTRIC